MQVLPRFFFRITRCSPAGAWEREPLPAARWFQPGIRPPLLTRNVLPGRAMGTPAGRTARRKCIGRFNLNYLNAPFYGRFCHTTSLLKISVWDAGKNYKALSCNYKGLGKNYKGLRKKYPALSFHQIPGFFPPTRPIKRRSRRGMCPACSVCTTKLLHFSAKSKSGFFVLTFGRTALPRPFISGGTCDPAGRCRGPGRADGRAAHTGRTTPAARRDAAWGR